MGFFCECDDWIPGRYENVIVQVFQQQRIRSLKKKLNPPSYIAIMNAELQISIKLRNVLKQKEQTPTTLNNYDRKWIVFNCKTSSYIREVNQKI